MEGTVSIPANTAEALLSLYKSVTAAASARNVMMAFKTAADAVGVRL